MQSTIEILRLTFFYISDNKLISSNKFHLTGLKIRAGSTIFLFVRRINNVLKYEIIIIKILCKHHVQQNPL